MSTTHRASPSARAEPAPLTQLVIVACSATKAATPRAALDLYTGKHFKLAWRAAIALRPHQLRILSAKHGLIQPHQVIAPYTQRSDRPGAISPERLAEQATDQQLLDQAPVVLGGSYYVDLVRDVWADVVAPLDGRDTLGSRTILARIATTGRLP